MFTNVGPVGIPLIVLAFGATGLASAVVLLVISNLLHFTLGSAVMSGRVDWRMVYANPLVWATLLGVTFSQLQWTLPTWFATPLGMIGNVLYVVGGARATMRPYALVGAGFYQSQLTLAGATTGLRSESADIGVQAGGGVQFALAGMTTFVEAKYVNVRRAGTPWSYLPITFGIRL